MWRLAPRAAEPEDNPETAVTRPRRLLTSDPSIHRSKKPELPCSEPARSLVLGLTTQSWDWGRNITLKPISELPTHWQIWYQEWDSSVLDNDNKQGLKSALLRNPGSPQSYAAAFELFLFSMFTNMGLHTKYQPKINCTTPDFFISDKIGNSAYIEAGAMFNDPIHKESLYSSLAMPIWAQFKELQSRHFSVQLAHSSGNPGDVSPKSVRHEIQQWIDELDCEVQHLIDQLDLGTSEMPNQHYHYIQPYKTFEFKKWRLDVELELKSTEDKDRLGATAVELAGFSGSWSDNPADRVKHKLKEKSSQVRKTRSHCIVAITESLEGFSVDDVQTALFGGTSECVFHYESQIFDSHPYIKGLSIPQSITDGLWSRHYAKEPIAALVHRGNLQNPDHGETELWLNPNSSYFRVPLPLFALKIHSAVQEIWTRPATRQ